MQSHTKQMHFLKHSTSAQILLLSYPVATWSDCVLQYLGIPVNAGMSSKYEFLHISYQKSCVCVTHHICCTLCMQAKLMLHTAVVQGYLHTLDICTQLSEWTLPAGSSSIALVARAARAWRCGAFFWVENVGLRFYDVCKTVTSVVVGTSPGAHLHWIELLSSFVANQVLCLSVLMPGPEHAWKLVSLQRMATPEPTVGQTLN